MKHVAMGAAIAAVALGLFFSNCSSAWADQSGDPDFCLGGWVKVGGIPTMTAEPEIVDEDATSYTLQTKTKTFVAGKWACASDL